MAATRMPRSLLARLVPLLGVALLTCQGRTNAMGSGNTEEFVERVFSFTSEPNHVNVAFSQHAGIYMLPVERDDFVQQMTHIAVAFKSDKAVRIVLRGQEIVSVGGP